MQRGQARRKNAASPRAGVASDFGHSGCESKFDLSGADGIGTLIRRHFFRFVPLFWRDIGSLELLEKTVFPFASRRHLPYRWP
jgi:hypothetical protein